MLGRFHTIFQKATLRDPWEVNELLCVADCNNMNPLAAEYDPEEPHPHVSLQERWMGAFPDRLSNNDFC